VNHGRTDARTDRRPENIASAGAYRRRRLKKFSGGNISRLLSLPPDPWRREGGREREGRENGDGKEGQNFPLDEILDTPLEQHEAKPCILNILLQQKTICT